MLGDFVTVAVTVADVSLPWRGAEVELPGADVADTDEVDLDVCSGEPGVEEVGKPVPVGDVWRLIVLFSVETSVFVKVFVDHECPVAHGVERFDAVIGEVSVELGEAVALPDDMGPEEDPPCCELEVALLTVTVLVNGTVITDVTLVVCGVGWVPVPVPKSLVELLYVGTIEPPVAEL